MRRDIVRFWEDEYNLSDPSSKKGRAMKIGRLLPVSILASALLSCGQEVKMVEVDPSNIKFTKRTQSKKVEAKALDIRGGEITGIGFTFQSENPSVAVVDSTGVVKPAGDGSTAIVAKTPAGVQGESFVKVCLPKDLICDPSDKLDLKVGIAAPIKCHVTDCNDKKISARIDLIAADEKMILKEGENIFIGLQVGDTEVTVKAFNFEKKVKVHVDEQEFLPGMGPGQGGGSKGKGGGGGGKEDSPYGSSGRFDHILKNMKFKN